MWVKCWVTEICNRLYVWCCLTIYRIIITYLAANGTETKYYIHLTYCIIRTSIYIPDYREYISSTIASNLPQIFIKWFYNFLRRLSIFSSLLWLKIYSNILTDYAKIMPENFSKIRKVILLDISQKGSSCANIWLKIMSEKSLCQIYYATGRNYARIKLEKWLCLNYARHVQIMPDRQYNITCNLSWLIHE